MPVTRRGRGATIPEVSRRRLMSQARALRGTRGLQGGGNLPITRRRKPTRRKSAITRAGRGIGRTVRKLKRRPVVRAQQRARVAARRRFGAGTSRRRPRR